MGWIGGVFAVGRSVDGNAGSRGHGMGGALEVVARDEVAVEI